MKVEIVCMCCQRVLRVEEWPDNEETRGMTSSGICVDCREYFDKHGEFLKKEGNK